MKRIFYIFIFEIGCSVAWADNLQIADGTLYRNVTVISANPERMLIVHDGGGCQVEFKDLAQDALTAEQRTVVAEELRYYVERKKRMDKAREEREIFEEAQRTKGLIKFEGVWVTMLEREEILMRREQQKIDLERQRMQLAKEKAQLEKERLQTEKARALLEGESRRSTYITYGYYTPSRRDCVYPAPYRHSIHGSKPEHHPANRWNGCDTTTIHRSQYNPVISINSSSHLGQGAFRR